MRAKRKQEVESRWGGRQDKATAAMDEVSKHPRKKVKKSKTCKATKGDHYKSKLKPIYGWLPPKPGDPQVWTCECGKHLGLTWFCVKCFAEYDWWESKRENRWTSEGRNGLCDECYATETDTGLGTEKV